MVTKTLTAAGPEKDNKIIEKIVRDHNNNISSSPLSLFSASWVDQNKIFLTITVLGSSIL